MSEYPILEPIVKLVVLSPLLKLAGFYRAPFYLTAEKEVEIESEDEGILVRGRLDLLVFTPKFWILVIEAKDRDFFDSFLICKEPYKLLLVTTGNITNTELEALFLKNLPSVSELFQESSLIELSRDAIIVHQ